MKKFLCVLLMTVILISSVAFADDTSDIKYLKSDESYDYGNGYVYAAFDKESGRVIPLSVSPFMGEGYYYAYLPGGGEIEVGKINLTVFTDIDMTYGGNYSVNELSARGIFTGFEDGTFREWETLTRAEMAAVFTRLFTIEPKNEPAGFSDVPEDSWYNGYIAALLDKGVFKKDVNFEPDTPVTREQLISMTCRMLNDMGYIKMSGDYDFSNYVDVDEVSEYALEAYNGLLLNNYYVITDINENNMMDTSDDEIFFDPQKSVTRYECADYLYNFIRCFFNNNAPAIKRDDAPAAEIPVLDGSTSTYDITRNIYWLYYINAENHPDFPKAHSKTTNSYKRLIDGEVEMIFVPDPGEEVEKYAEEKGVKLRFVPIANEALIFFTAADNKADNITTEQLYDIYVNNGIKNWSEIGGDDAELVAYCRNNDSGSHAQMENFILDGNTINEEISRERTSLHMSSILTEVDAFNKQNSGKYALGYSLYYYYFNNQQVLGPVDLKLMSIDGVAPTEETIADGTYPYTTNYYAVVRDEENEKVDAFLELMQGEFGDDIITRCGFGVIK